MAELLQILRTASAHKRAVVAAIGAAAVVFGIAQTTGTMAAEQDDVEATTSQIASQNFFPTPLPTSISCSESGTLGFHNANVSWPSAGAGMKYRVTLWNEAMTSVERGPSFQDGTGWTLSVNYNLAWNNYVVTVETVNVASNTADANRLVSSGHRRITVGSNAQRNASCQGGAGVKANATWEDGASWAPAEPQVFGRSSVGPERELQRQTPSSVSKTPDAETEETTTTSAPEPSETSASPTTSEKPTSEKPGDDSEEPTSTSAVPSRPSASKSAAEPIITAGVIAGSTSKFVVSHDGVEKCRGDKDATDVVSVRGNEVALTTSDGAVKKIDPYTCRTS
ncbi:hypothetical protein JVX90_16725 [Gordonia sp. PDNC005]|uniref:hypothetical protein n=1 Tax=unclassified Gordonia (in: high G+C Gram-positive bacteria) TaxID=2657482 RepID=UPI0019666329|nr:hypothetical protein [Gordonia sp. PDNC005]QRY62026.1 hypothetical protein JVX90_16725 [Gordonia sp. PDNC005]